jgi:hypothetical protein
MPCPFTVTTIVSNKRPKNVPGKQKGRPRVRRRPFVTEKGPGWFANCSFAFGLLPGGDYLGMEQKVADLPAEVGVPERFYSRRQYLVGPF